MIIRTVLASFLISGSLFAANITRNITPGKSTYMVSMTEDESISFQEKELTVRIENIQDLRCPPDMQCFWPGSINFDLALSKHSLMSQISLMYQKPVFIPFEGYGLTITKVIKTTLKYEIQMEIVNKED